MLLIDLIATVVYAYHWPSYSDSNQNEVMTLNAMIERMKMQIETIERENASLKVALL